MTFIIAVQTKDSVIVAGDTQKFIFNNQSMVPSDGFIHNEMLAMLEVINIFIDDKEKSSELLEELYERYIGQISMIEQGSVIAFLEYDGMYFSMSGTKIAFHPLEQCNGSCLYGIYIE